MTILDLIQLIKRNVRVVVAIPVLCMIVTGCASLLIGNTYTASINLYVLPSLDNENPDDQVAESQNLTADIVSLAQSDGVKCAVATDLGLDDFEGYRMSVTTDDSTRIVTVSVSSGEARQSIKMVNSVANVVMESVNSAHAVQGGVVSATEASSAIEARPKRWVYAACAAVAGFFCVTMTLAIQECVRTYSADNAG